MTKDKEVRLRVIGGWTYRDLRTGRSRMITGPNLTALWSQCHRHRHLRHANERPPRPALPAPPHPHAIPNTTTMPSADPPPPPILGIEMAPHFQARTVMRPIEGHGKRTTEVRGGGMAGAVPCGWLCHPSTHHDTPCGPRSPSRLTLPIYSPERSCSATATRLVRQRARRSTRQVGIVLDDVNIRSATSRASTHSSLKHTTQHGRTGDPAPRRHRPSSPPCPLLSCLHRAHTTHCVRWKLRKPPRTNTGNSPTQPTRSMSNRGSWKLRANRAFSSVGIR